MPGIGLAEGPIAVAGEHLSVQTTEIVEGQEAARFDRYAHVLSIDFRRKLRQSIAVGRII